MRYELECDFCGKKIFRYPSVIKKHNFCSRECLSTYGNKEKNPEGYLQLKDYTNMGKHLSELNKKLNPTRMTPETRAKLRKARLGTGEGKTYTKIYGKHEHRVLAEKMLGRKLHKGEVVHHIDGDKRNNVPENLMVLSSQKEHSELHVRDRRFWRGGDAK